MTATEFATAMRANPFTRSSLANLRRKRASGLIISNHAATALLMNNARDTDRTMPVDIARQAVQLILADFHSETE